MAQEPIATANTDGSFTLTMDRETWLAVAACLALQRGRIEEALPAQRRLIGDPGWQRSQGEGADGLMSRGELQQFLVARGLPTEGL
jgi:hypothetical protein